MHEHDQAEIDAANARIDKADALLSATRKLTYLVKAAKRSAEGKPQSHAIRALITKALKAQLGLIRELDKTRGN